MPTKIGTVSATGDVRRIRYVYALEEGTVACRRGLMQGLRDDHIAVAPLVQSRPSAAPEVGSSTSVARNSVYFHFFEEVRKFTVSQFHIFAVSQFRSSNFDVACAKIGINF